VLRKIIRRAALFVKKLNGDIKLFPQLAEEFVKVMSPVFPELKENKKRILTVLTCEVERFASSLEQGQQIFDKYVSEIKKAGKKIVAGSEIFKLYDTYGFPPELTRVMAYDQGLDVDMPGFEKEMGKQKAQSGKKDKEAEVSLSIPDNICTDFVGYECMATKSKVTCVQRENGFLWIVTDKCPFYVESGGQVGDTGTVSKGKNIYPVKGLQKVGDAIAIKLETKDKLKTGDEVELAVDCCKRDRSVKNHTATHLLQAALVKVLGNTVKQAGSLVCEDYLRFDFAHHEAVSADQIKEVEEIVNREIQKNIQLQISHTSLKEAQSAGVTAFFGDKYNPEKVRVVQIGDVSAELCGGTHARSTGEIGAFKIIEESALGTGIRRITAVTGSEAVKLFQTSFGTVKALGELFSVKLGQVRDAVLKQQEACSQSQKTIKQLRKKLLQTKIPGWQSEVEKVGKIPFLFLSLDLSECDDLRSICVEIEKKSPGFYFILAQDSDSARFVGYVSKSFKLENGRNSSDVDLKKLGQILKDSCGLRGGGSSSFIQGGGPKIKAKEVKETVEAWLTK